MTRVANFWVKYRSCDTVIIVPSKIASIFQHFACLNVQMVCAVHQKLITKSDLLIFLNCKRVSPPLSFAIGLNTSSPQIQTQPVHYEFFPGEIKFTAERPAIRMLVNFVEDGQFFMQLGKILCVIREVDIRAYFKVTCSCSKISC